jgi:hypothetical protein
VVVTTASGFTLAKGGTLALQKQELAPLLAHYLGLPETERRPALPPAETAIAPKRSLPQPPEGGLILRGYCTYLQQDDAGPIERKRRLYYQENPDAWAAETQSDTLWLTKEEWSSLLPSTTKKGTILQVARPICERFYGSIGIDYMEGSVNALPLTKGSMIIEIGEVTKTDLTLELKGSGQMGIPFEDHRRNSPDSRGCTLQVTGKLTIDRQSGTFTRFDILGTGTAWGNKMNYTKRAIHIEDYPWRYGIACELVTTRKPVDLLPPYNLVHYGNGIPYFNK